MAGIVLALAVVVVVLYARQHPELMVQAQLNQRFAERPLDAAFEKYPKLRPPLYPLALWGAARLGVGPGAFQQGMMIGLLGLMAGALVSALRCVHPAWPLLGFAVAHFNYVNLAQPTAETLFAPLAVLLVIALRSYARTPDLRRLSPLAVVVSALCLIRYFALQFALPLAAAAILLRARPWRRAAAHAAVLAAAALLPVGSWMWVTFQQTGHWTGADRTQPRQLPGMAEHWEEIDTLPEHAVLAVKTLWVDFLAPDVYAAHAVVTRPYALSPIEWGLVAVFVGAIAAAAVTVRPAPTAAVAAEQDAPSWAAAGRLEALAAGFYLLMTLAVWSVSNNDPIYTRFLFPMYPLLWIALAHGYDLLRRRTSSPWPLLPWRVLFGAFVVLQAVRSWKAEPLPVRYLW